MDRFPQVEPNSNSSLGPILVMDRGFGKLKLVLSLSAKNFKILTIAAALGSEHPIVPSSAQDTSKGARASSPFWRTCGRIKESP